MKPKKSTLAKRVREAVAHGSKMPKLKPGEWKRVSVKLPRRPTCPPDSPCPICKERTLPCDACDRLNDGVMIVKHTCGRREMTLSEAELVDAALASKSPGYLGNRFMQACAAVRKERAP